MVRVAADPVTAAELTAPAVLSGAPARRRIGAIMAGRMQGAMTVNKGWRRLRFGPLAVLAATFLLTLCLALPALAEPPIPVLTGRVVDQAGILDRATIDAITNQLAGYESATGNQVVVVTLSELKGYPIEDWGLALGRGWGIGQNGKNNGALLIVAPNDHDVRIEVGYGLEGDLPDATANTIIQQEIIPQFKRGDLKGGVQAGVTAILAALGGKYTPTRLTSSPASGNEFPAGAFSVFAFIFIVIVMIVTRRDYGPGVQHGRRRDNDGGFGSFGGGGSHSSGGGFSGGGGSFGGGGASGHW
jgi:uncharacterized protein